MGPVLHASAGIRARERTTSGLCNWARALGLVLVTGLASAQGKVAEEGTIVSGAVAERIDDYLARCVPFGFSGSALVAKDGTVILSKGYGVADRETGVPCTPQTIFDIGSLTKQFTASAALLLEQQKKLKTKDTLDKFLEDVPADKRKIQLLHLMSHTAGFPRGIDGVGSRMNDREELIQAVLRAPLRDSPGTQLSYSNVDYDLLAALLEIVAEKPFEPLLEELVFRPAGLTSTGFRKDGKLPASLAARAFLKPDDPPPAGSLLEKSREKPHEAAAGSDERELATEGWYTWGLRGAGGVLSTVEDLWRWEQTLQGDKLLDKASKKKLFTPVREDYACGWYVLQTKRRTTWIEHGGSTASGFEAKCSRFPDEAAYSVLLGNAPGLVPWIHQNVNELLFGGTCVLPPSPATVPPETLAALEGEYEHRSGAHFRASIRANALVLEARSKEAFELIAGKLSGDMKHLLVLSEKVVAGFPRADFAEVHALETESTKFFWIESWWQDLLKHHGELRTATLLGLFHDPERANQAVVLLEFSRGEELLRLEWGEEDLLGLNIGPPYPSRLRLVPASAESFVWFDLQRGTKTAEARIQEGGRELELVLPGGSLVVAKR